MKKTLFIVTFLSISFFAHSTDFLKDTLKVSKVKTIELDTIKRHSPKKAGLYSAVLPGLGQAYNGHFVKIPFIYAISGVTLGIALKKHTEYKIFRTVNDINIKGEYTMQYNDVLTDLGKDNPVFFKSNRDAARSSRDMFFVYTGIVYVLNIMDAMVSAHLKEFTVSSKDLSFQIEPTIIYQNNKASTGFALTINF